MNHGFNDVCIKLSCSPCSGALGIVLVVLYFPGIQRRTLGKILLLYIMFLLLMKKNICDRLTRGPTIRTKAKAHAQYIFQILLLESIHNTTLI